MNSRPRWLWLRSMITVCIFCLGVMLLFSQMISLAQAQGGSGQEQSILPIDKPDGKLSPRLEMLAQPAIAGQDAETQARTLSLAPTGPGSLLKNEQDQILVYIRLSTISEDTLTALAAAGATVIHVAEEYNIATAYVSPSSLLSVSDVEAVLSMREEVAPIISGAASQTTDDVRSDLFRPPFQADCAGAITSEGDSQLNADDARTTFGLDGSGVTVGILSDSYDKDTSAGTNATQDIASGDLPGTGNPCGRTTAVNVVAESTAAENTDEGRAMLQIVHDLAPGANLAFATALGGEFAFADNIRALRNAGADIVVDDIAYFVEPFFQDGPVSVAIQDVTSSGSLYFTAAGNSNATDSGGNDIASYEVVAYRSTTCPSEFISGASCHNFSATGNDNTYGLTIQNGGGITLILQWAEPRFGVQTDLDIYLFDAAGTLVSGSNFNSLTDQFPVEFFTFSNGGATQAFNLVINRRSGSTATPRLKYILLRSSGLTATEYNASNSTDTFGPTIFGHAGEDTALSIAAVPVVDSNTPEPFTSLGFFTAYYGPVVGTTPAAALSSPDTRAKPDVAASDGGCNTYFGQFFNGCFRFFGTSAAAPHAGAVAALMKERANALSKPLVQGFAESILEKTAATITNGSPQATGAGLINATAAITGVNDLEIRTVFLPIILKN